MSKKITFEEAFIEELAKLESKLPEAKLKSWIAKTPIGKAAMAAYKRVHA
jgi:hypothetical protein